MVYYNVEDAKGAYVSPGIEGHIDNIVKRKRGNSVFKMSVDRYSTMSNEEFKDILKEDYHIEIYDIESISEDQRLALSMVLRKHTYRKVGNVVGFMNSKDNGPYKDTSKYSRDILKGSYNDIYALSAIMLRVGWNKGSGQAVSSENSSFNRFVDKESLEITRKVLDVSKKGNIDQDNFPLSGLVLVVQLLRLLGWDKREIVYESKHNLLYKTVLIELDSKMPKTLGSVQAERLIKRNFSSEEIIDKLNWD